MKKSFFYLHLLILLGGFSSLYTQASDLTTPSEYAATGTVPNALAPNQQRLHMQINYALQARTAVMTFILAWQQQNQVMPATGDFNRFAQQLLFNGQDPIVADIEYVPNEWVAVKLADTDFIVPLLRGVELLQRLQPVTATGGVFLSPAPDSPADSPPPMGDVDGADAESDMNPNLTFTALPEPLFLDALHCMGIVTSYCKVPQGFKADGGAWLDQDWCPVWHEYVMPPPELVPFED